MLPPIRGQRQGRACRLRAFDSDAGCQLSREKKAAAPKYSAEDWCATRWVSYQRKTPLLSLDGRAANPIPRPEL